MIIKLETYWFTSPTGKVYEQKFTQAQIDNRGWVLEPDGLPFIKAAKLVEEWNKLGNKNGYHYTLHKPEILLK